MAAAETKFVFECAATAKNALLKDGFDVRYGARNLKRSVERLLVSPLSDLLASEQVEFGDLIYIDVDSETEKFTFARRPGAFKSDAVESVMASEASGQLDGSIGMAAYAIKAANVFSN